MVLDLLQGASVMLALCWLQTVCAGIWGERQFASKISSGLLYGLTCVVGMLAPVAIATGIFTDARLVVISIAGLFGGPWVAGTALLVAGVARLWIGGAGAMVGTAGMLLAAASGLSYRHAVRKGWLKEGALQFLAFGFLVQGASLLIFLWLQRGNDVPVLQVSAATLAVMPGFTMLVGLLLQEAQQRIADVRDLSQSAARLRAVAEAVPDVLMVVDEDGRYLEFVSPQRDLLHVALPHLVGRHMHEVLPPQYADLFLAFIRRVLSSIGSPDIEYAMQAEGKLRIFEVRAKKMDRPSGARQAVVLVTRDITERRATEEQIRALALYDPLTELPNRSFLLARLPYARQQSAHTGRHAALLLIDLDDFRTLNDDHGNLAGDRMLGEVGDRLRGLALAGATIARLGGDEFVILVEGLAANEQDAAAEAARMGLRVTSALALPYAIDDRTHAGSASVGVALFGDMNAKDNPMRRAELALFAAKAHGKNRVQIYDPVVQDAITARLALEAEIRLGLQRGEFLIHYQPQFGTLSTPIGVEALVRWQHPTRGLLPPGDFLPVAESAGLMLELDTQVLTGACIQLARWATDPVLAELFVSVNISGFQLSQPDFASGVLEIAAATGADPGHLKLEITETALVNDMSMAILHMVTLKKRGIRFALDDFGTGYSSMSYLQRLPLNQLKIDQSFVRGLPGDPGSVAIVRAIVALAANFGFDVLAEGVENEAQRTALADNGCHCYQGFLFSRALPHLQLEAMVRAAEAH